MTRRAARGEEGQVPDRVLARNVTAHPQGTRAMRMHKQACVKREGSCPPGSVTILTRQASSLATGKAVQTLSAHGKPRRPPLPLLHAAPRFLGPLRFPNVPGTYQRTMEKPGGRLVGAVPAPHPHIRTPAAGKPAVAAACCPCTLPRSHATAPMDASNIRMFHGRARLFRAATAIKAKTNTP